MRLGHFALSQTVSSRSSSSNRAVKWLAFPFGTLCFSQRGERRSRLRHLVGRDDRQAN